MIESTVCDPDPSVNSIPLRALRVERPFGVRAQRLIFKIFPVNEISRFPIRSPAESSPVLLLILEGRESRDGPRLLEPKKSG